MGKTTLAPVQAGTRQVSESIQYGNFLRRAVGTATMLQLTSTLHTEKSTEKEKTGTNAHRSIRSDNHGFIGFLGGLAVVMLSLGAAAAIAKGLIAIDVLPTSDAAPFIFYLGAAFAVSCFAAGAIFD